MRRSLATNFHIVKDEYRLDSERDKMRINRKDSIQKYLGSYPIRKLHLGAGFTPLDGWLNSDISPTSEEIFFLDVTESFPFDDNSFSYIFSEHLLEHITYVHARFMLLESYRVLKPGGRIRFATPDIRRLVELYRLEKNDVQKHYLESASIYFEKFFPPDIGPMMECFLVNLFFREWNHQFIYDFETLKAEIKRANFVDVVEYSPGESDDTNLKNIESHGRIIGDFMNQFETMVVEARKDGNH